ncbi:MAG: hypothetical protein IJ801_04075 [Lachnospiraceae bacterium]|nr:hypothetical protein [Lachnospiraceae bacterium]
MEHLEDYEPNEMEQTTEEAELSGSNFECSSGHTPDFPPHREVINVLDAVIDEITTNRNTTLVTITYRSCPTCKEPKQTVTLIIGPETALRNEHGGSVRVNELREGMVIHASFSPTMTRSNPPQAQAFLLIIVKRPETRETTIGRIAEVNPRNDFLVVIQNQNPSSAIRFHISQETVILDPIGRRIPLSRLRPGLRVRVEHASFMTASIPPQTTAFTVQVIR